MTPIEDKLWRAFGDFADGTGVVLRLTVEGLSFLEIERISADLWWPRGGVLVLAPQVACGRYRIDFGGIARGAISKTRVAIECDRHDFHEKTKAQAAHDKARDRALTAEGIRVVRFTGSEIWRAPDACVASLLGIVSNELQRQCEIRHLGQEVSHAS